MKRIAIAIMALAVSTPVFAKKPECPTGYRAVPQTGMCNSQGALIPCSQMTPKQYRCVAAKTSDRADETTGYFWVGNAYNSIAIPAPFVSWALPDGTQLAQCKNKHGVLYACQISKGYTLDDLLNMVYSLESRK